LKKREIPKKSGKYPFYQTIVVINPSKL